MNQAMICSARYGQLPGGLACGPIDRLCASELEVQNGDGETEFYLLHSFMGELSFYRTPRSFFMASIAEEWDEPELDQLNQYLVDLDPLEVLDNKAAEYHAILCILDNLANRSETPDVVYAEELAGKAIASVDISALPHP